MSSSKSGARVPFWALVLVAVLCLALGITMGFTVRGDDDQPVDPSASGPTKKRQALVSQANEELAALTQLDAATNIKGAPSSFGLVTLGKEERDVCATGQHGFKVNDWYDSACGVQVTWFLAARSGSTKMLEAAANQRLRARRIPKVGAFTWKEDTGPLPSKLSGDVHVTHDRSASSLRGFQHSTALRMPEQDAVYHDVVRTFDLPTAYRDHGGKRKHVIRVTLLAQYAWN